MNKFTILGCGSSLGTPWITRYSSKLDMNEKKNHRTRCSAHITFKNLSILIDTSPDIKKQILDNKIRHVDSILYTHEHADQTSGIFEMRPFYWMKKSKIPVFASKRTLRELKKSYSFCFKEKHGYKPILKPIEVKKSFYVSKDKIKLRIESFSVQHGMIQATGYKFKKIAYISDCNYILPKSIKFLKDLNYLIIDCLRIQKHSSHFNLESALDLIKKVKPKKSILTNLHVDLDYKKLKKILPKNVFPAYDGLKISF
tara:strand:- start:452 stop:1219 length:768 start_codon:yes stop_codon:yes gene_type:complete